MKKIVLTLTTLCLFAVTACGQVDNARSSGSDNSNPNANSGNDAAGGNSSNQVNLNALNQLITALQLQINQMISFQQVLHNSLNPDVLPVKKQVDSLVSQMQTGLTQAQSVTQTQNPTNATVSTALTSLQNLQATMTPTLNLILGQNLTTTQQNLRMNFLTGRYHSLLEMKPKNPGDNDPDSIAVDVDLYSSFNTKTTYSGDITLTYMYNKDLKSVTLSSIFFSSPSDVVVSGYPCACSTPASLHVTNKTLSITPSATDDLSIALNGLVSSVTFPTVSINTSAAYYFTDGLSQNNPLTTVCLSYLGQLDPSICTSAY